MDNQKQTKYANVVLVKDTSVLLQLRDDKPGIAYPGSWDLPGGKIEEGEEPEVAAVREFCEETDYQLKNPQYLTSVEYTFIDGNPIAVFFIENYDGVQPINCHEGQKMEFVPIEEALKLDLFYGHGEVIETAMKYK